ncbi:DUF1330 domain-containing protein [Yoonia litorea]|uniref:Uncharacterized conserved protein, DUF1330 family n=1 Tax=Yoonia litorea TaxID=1123755 RepID=A0A1I6LQ25_9RHOB|nr:DUF1330 domain-containing protein [Yoonia litorea]SFS05584.1 Uncharacterized conserved protein, DUF1330 family [Yoonia litorea]
MAVYAIIQVDVKDSEAYAKYAELAGPAVAKYGGEFLVRGGQVEVMEGTTKPRCVIIRFADMATAKAFYHGEEYQEALSYGLPASDRDYKFVEGVD